VKDRCNVLLVCAMGYSTSSLLKLHLSKFFRENNIVADLQSTSLSSIKNYLNKADIIVTSLPLQEDEYKIPVINAMELISGRNKEDVLNKILTAIKNL